MPLYCCAFWLHWRQQHYRPCDPVGTAAAGWAPRFTRVSPRPHSHCLASPAVVQQRAREQFEEEIRFRGDLRNEAKLRAEQIMRKVRARPRTARSTQVTADVHYCCF